VDTAVPSSKATANSTGRGLDIHLTGNMERFMWSFDGVKMSDAMEPIPFVENERERTGADARTRTLPEADRQKAHAVAEVVAS